MDIFNKKKIKDLSHKLKLFDEIIKQKELEIRKNKVIIEDLQQTSNYLQNENQKLLDWIEKILDAVGTADYNAKNTFVIPVHKESISAFQDGFSKPYLQEKIVIPEIIICKNKF